jgi:hypothetical protein
MVIGTVLVLLTWTLVLAVWIGSGYALTGRPSGSRTQSVAVRARRSVWWGLALFTVAVLAVGLFAPLWSGTALLVVVAILTPFVAIGVLAFRRQLMNQTRSRRVRPLTTPVAVAGVIALVYLAWAALGPATNYDTGLYHLGAIRYAGEFATIPGLANLYFPFGYNTAQFPLAAFLGNGPWGAGGFRLINGLLLFAMVADLLLRLRSRSLGTYILAVGVVVTLVPMVALDDYWVTSPSSDPAVMIITFLSLAYLADGLVNRRDGSADLVIALVLAIVSVTLRPLMAVFALAVLAVVLFSQRRSSERISPKAWVSVLILGGVLGVIQSARDYLLSGWLQFPLSVFAFDVPWRAANPAENRTATLGAARDPLNLWDAAESWNWIGPWIQRLPMQWEPFLFIGLLVAAIVVLVPLRFRIRWRLLLAITTPALVTVVIWFLFSPPSFRFAWGPVFALGILPLAMALHSWGTGTNVRSRFDLPRWAFVAAGVVVLAVTVFTAVFRSDPQSRTELVVWQLGPVTIDVPAAPALLPPVREQMLTSGLMVRIPTESDQCWAVYPLCTAQLAPTVALRGNDIGKGFILK